MTRTAPSRPAVVLATLLACALVVGLAVPATVGAGDTGASFAVEPNEAEVEAGDTVTFDVVASTPGDHVGDGIDELSFTLEYDPDVFAVADVEHGPMLADDDPDVEVDGSVDVDDDAGSVTVEQVRDPAGNGTKGTDTAASITLEVAEDAPTSEEELEFADAEAVLVSGYPQGTVERDATVDVQGGDGSDSVPGFAPAATLAGVGLVALLLARRSRSR